MSSSSASPSRRTAESSIPPDSKSERPMPSVKGKKGGSMKKGDPATLEPVAALVVPLPRRPLFPGYGTAAYLKNQSSLARSLAGAGAGAGEKVLAAFMLKDKEDYRGCILRPGLQGKELLERLHTVGTLAEVKGPILWENSGQVKFRGHRRVRMTGIVVLDDPLTVMVEPMEEVQDEGVELERILEQGRHPRPELERQVMSMYAPFRDVFLLLQALSGKHLMDPSGQVGFYMNMWERDLGFLPDFGPAVLPVLDKSFYQRALEEPNRSKRLQLTTAMLKQELEMDKDLSKELDLHEDTLYEEEKELLAELRRPVKPILAEQSSLSCKGEALIAPSVQIRVTMNEFHDVMPPDVLENMKKNHKAIRESEHLFGY